MVFLYEKDAWVNSMLSVAKYSGGVTFEKLTFVVVNKFGKTLYETSIPQGEPADLVLENLVPYYKKLGREEFMKKLKEMPTGLTWKDAVKFFKEATKTKPKTKDDSKQLNLF